jgi:DNA-binding NtrC family response regulator
MQEAISVAIVGSDPKISERVGQAMAAYRTQIAVFQPLSPMLETLSESSMIDVVILELEPPFEQAFDLLARLKAKLTNVEVVFLTRFDDDTLWVEAIQRGAYDLLPRPVDVSELKRILTNAVERHRGKQWVAQCPSLDQAKSCHA